MRTVILAWVIGLLGLVMIGGGIWGVIDLYRQEVRAPLKSYGGAISMICGGVVGRDAGAAYTARRFLLHGNARMTLARSLSSRAWTKAQGNDEGRAMSAPSYSVVILGHVGPFAHRFIGR